MTFSLPPWTPPPWTNQSLVLYHGTLDTYARSIVRKVVIAKGRTRTDFGRGFYTTTTLLQARTWAWMRAQRRRGKGIRPAVVRLELDRDALADLQTLCFVRGDFDAEDFWSIVFHCRSGNLPHARMLPAKPEYDVVVGPAAASWRQRLTIFGADQFSFHTSDAESLLNSSKCKRSIVP